MAEILEKKERGEMTQLTYFGQTIDNLKARGLIHDRCPKLREHEFEVCFYLDFNTSPCWVLAEDMHAVMTENGGILYQVLANNYVISNAELSPMHQQIHVVPAYEVNKDTPVTQFDYFIPRSIITTVEETLHIDLFNLLANTSANSANMKFLRLYIDHLSYAFIASEETYIRIFGFLVKMGLPLKTLRDATSSRSQCRGNRPTFVGDVNGINIWYYIKYCKRFWWKLAMVFGPDTLFKMK